MSENTTYTQPAVTDSSVTYGINNPNLQYANNATPLPKTDDLDEKNDNGFRYGVLYSDLNNRINTLENKVKKLEKQVVKLKNEKVKFYHSIELLVCIVIAVIIIVPFALVVSMIYFPEVYLTKFKGFFNNPITQSGVWAILGCLATVAYNKANKSITTKDEDFD